MDFLSAFDVDSAERHDEQKAARHASVLFNQRATARFLPFLRQSAHRDEFEARLSLIERDLNRMAAEITAETGHDAAYFVEHYKTHVAGGAFCDDCRKWKSGPKAGLCVCDEEGEEEPTGEKESRTVQAMPGAPGQGWHGEAQPEGNEVCGHCGQPVDTLSNVDRCPHCGNSTGGPGMDQFGEQMWDKLFGGGGRGASTSVPFKVVAANEDNLGGKGKPSGPKMDKSNAGDEKSNKKRDPIDTDGGRYKTERQDVADSADYANEDFLEQTETVTDHDVDVAKKSEVKGDKTDTWSGKGGQANPVTSHFLASEDATRAIEAFHADGPIDLTHEDFDGEPESCSDCDVKQASKVGDDGIARCDECAREAEKFARNRKRDALGLDD